MITSIQDCAVLANGVKMPWLGLGVYKAEEGKEVEEAVKIALQAGYRSVDTAMIYQNEEGVGKGIRDSGVNRDEIFVATKVWNTDQGYEETLQAFEESRQKLGLDVIDLYLVHWPVEGKYKETWRALEKLYKDGKVRAIGVSNFQIRHLEDLIKDAEIKPMVNQVEFHPNLTQKELLNFCKKEQIQLEAWRPLTQGKLFTDPVVMALAEKYSKTPAQILLRWNLELEVVTIPKSVNKERITANADIYSFSLETEDIEQLDNLNKNERYGPDPDNFDF
ncbi:aldo/keto reductase [Bacillus sp. FJAT-45350]|uniref:aldo/keto reductase n=1 Tax=Bacillus sp. FJAT-45350 TaxID=2011014 RepID=UPI0015CB220D|nr:aldo/keto reductase [Bacillus sp. FJAT-45350]